MLATIIIAARNASGTIERAVRSALLQGGNHPIVLVDDFSSDDTVARAVEAGAGRLKIVQLPEHTSLGQTRQAGLDAIATPFGVWLDADDEFLPGRVERLVAVLDREHGDLASDALELCDGNTSHFLRHLTIPPFLKGHQPMARLFERNYLQGIGVVAFRSAFARRIGYDSNFHGAEDMDFALRCIAAGARFCLIDDPGYRLYSYPHSTSRQRENQLEMYRRCLLKHDYDSVRRLFLAAGYDTRVCAWGLASMALFRTEFTAALEFIAVAESLMTEPDEILEPCGPCPLPENWRLAFFRGTALLKLERWQDGRFWLEQAEQIQPTAEGANNLGVAMARQGKLLAARQFFQRSLARFPEYADALANGEAEVPSRVTLHPLRREASRMDY